MKKNTTPKKLLDAINNKKLSVVGGKIYSVDMVRNYPPDQFVEELEFLCESGCFAEMIDIKYTFTVQGDLTRDTLPELNKILDLASSKTQNDIRKNKRRFG